MDFKIQSIELSIRHTNCSVNLQTLPNN